MADDRVPAGSRATRLRGIVGLAGRRTYARATGSGARRLWLSVGGVAIAIALMVVVTGVGLGLAAQSTVQSEGVDYWITPEGGGGSAVVETGGPQFGQVHSVATRLEADDRVEFATPMALQVLRMRGAASAEPEYVLAIGVIPSAGIDEVGGLSTRGLSPGDPYYANGSYDGAWTGDVVLSPAAAELLNASRGDRLSVFSTNRRASQLAVAGVSESSVSTGVGQLPVAVFRLSELQTLTGGAAGDRADQILVSTDAPAVRDELERIYPRSTVVTRTGLTTQQVSDADLPLAVSLTAFVVALVVGTLFVATTMGLELLADRTQLAVLAAVGFRGRDRALLVVTQTLCVTLAGGALGTALGVGGIHLTNALTAEYLVARQVAVFHPVLVAYAAGVAVLIGLLAAPYLLYVLRRTTTMEALAT